MTPNSYRALIRHVRTPYKAGRLLLSPSYQSGSYDSHAVDCPFPFSHQGTFGMTFVGWDGKGYRTGLAWSGDLLKWEKEGMVIDRGPSGSITEHNVALTCILRDNKLESPGELRPVDGLFVGTYHAYPQPGYEEGPAVIGLCTSPDLRRWETGEPILRPHPACSWEAGGLYKSWLLEHAGTYYLFYNAKNLTRGPWREQTGLAISNDLVHWERYGGNPLLTNGPSGAFDDIFASDPCVMRYEDSWVLFYFGYCSDGHARDGCAFSPNLLHWEKSAEILVDVSPPGAIDSIHAHKPGIVSHAGILYHFYCGVAPMNGAQQGGIMPVESRGITLAVNDSKAFSQLG